MNYEFLRVGPVATLSLLLGGAAFGHDLSRDPEHPHSDFAVKPPEIILAQATAPQSRAQVGGRSVRTNKPVQAASFEAFARAVTLRWDERFLFIESNGLPAHNMMVGITAWQQQVPLPQKYSGANAWQIPLVPVPAKDPASIKNRFLRGAIALAVNGIPIFNPQNNRGEVSQDIGELDEWGGHCGRADDYHYHAAPLHLQSVLGTKLPIAYALDGYPIYGLTEPDGAAPSGLDVFNGHTTPALGYHYHASKQYPFVNGGFHGEVVERDGQVDPQPRANGVREAGAPLRGAKITGFVATGNSYKLTYDLNGEQRAVAYAINADGTFPFEFQNGRAGTTKEVYTLRQRGPGGGGGERGGRGGPPRREGGEPERRGGPRSEAPQGEGSKIPMDALKKPSASFILTSPEVGTDGALPVDFTGDGSGATLPLAWKGAPAGTQSFAVVMDHLAPGDQVKTYWTLWDIPASTTGLPKNARGIGKVGASFRGAVGYEPPHSQGPGAKTYVLSVYALSAPPQIALPEREVSRDVLLTSMKDKVLASASMNVTYSRGGSVGGPPEGRRPRETGTQDRAAPGAQGEGPRPEGDSRISQPDRRRDAAPPAAPGGDPFSRGAQLFAAADPVPPQPGEPRRPGGGKGKGGPPGLIKPSIADTMKLNVYADNWFMLYVNGRLVAVDSIQFTPHNVVSVDFLPEYPMTIAVMAKDNADPKTGMEYGTNIGDGGFILKFGDGTVTNATWKAKSFFKGPLNHDTANPKVEHTPIPDGWWKTDFDDSKWANATEYTEERINPKQPYFEADFKGAKFIWTEDLDLDNTIIFRTKIEKPDWKQRWNTKPDLDVTGAPLK